MRSASRTACSRRTKELRGTTLKPQTLPGTRPPGTRGDREAAQSVRQMFGRIAPRYDFLNHALSLQMDRVWRRRVAKRFRNILLREHASVLDLCCGTGDLTAGLARSGRARVIGTDFAHPMLVQALRKCSLGRANHRVIPRQLFAEADALALPFADHSFDLLTAAFGFRNLASYERGLLEMYRVLRPGGEVGILEFAEPRGRMFSALYRFYFRKILPSLGGAISGDRAAYTYLPDSVAKFPSPEALAALMEQVGFVNLSFERWTGGIVTLHRARR
ncbi:MAG TPA: bifunctional demethylmenaquinone methyltransferase/2-methoxy-6-polyprenyl-1,4-benzoquinol methylase UbiE [Candidatus Dormibacteraeota bacterium]|nr:bifunctional demethylmenaquinone methyltransferase/2-methoxy-6-polyprenyl-1,4-benzoquinol methylase UbiE [Candidatus Dormibacteraeota bacterium]